MKKSILLVAAAMMIASCGFMKNSTQGQSSNAQSSNVQTTAANTNAAMSAGQGAGTALQALYNQYKADGNRYDYQNMQNVLNTVSLLANCEGLKTNYTDKTYLKEFGKGMIASSLGLVTQNNVNTVTNSLVDMIKNSEAVQATAGKVNETASQAASTASTAANYASTAAQYASSLSSILSLFGK